MKKIVIICLSAIALTLNYACNDSLDKELFEKSVLLTNNGWIDEEMQITESGLIEVPLVLSINGTDGNDKSVDVRMKFDSDTLSAYNFNKYRNQTALYYNEVPTGAVTFKDAIINIPSGKIKSTSALILDTKQITDKYADYVIPVAIESVSEYKVGQNIYSKALLHVLLKNSFSGNYAGDLGVFKITDTGNKITVSNKTFYAVTSNKCYFFAGQMDRSKMDRNKFIVNITIDNEGVITMESPNPDLLFKQESAKITITKENHPNDNRYEIVTTALTLAYTFKDLTLVDKPTLRCTGTVSIQKNVLKVQP